jgi:hypothetical protein
VLLIPAAMLGGGLSVLQGGVLMPPYQVAEVRQAAPAPVVIEEAPVVPPPPYVPPVFAPRQSRN